MLAVARALARDLKLLLLDEPYEGLAPTIVREIEKILLAVKELGITTVIVEQNAIAALNLAHRALILDMGENVFDGSAGGVHDDTTLRQRYLASCGSPAARDGLPGAGWRAPRRRLSRGRGEGQGGVASVPHG